MKEVYLSWSSGKDSAWALHVLRQRRDLAVVGLLTTVNGQFQRVAMHGTRVELVRRQAIAVGLPLKEVELPWPCSNEAYESAMMACCRELVDARVDAVAFGDLFLEDVRAYRERQMKGSGLEPLFPLWRIPTRELAETMIAAGLRAKVATLDPQRVPPELAGCEFDQELLGRLPSEVDPCAENGEFHTFAYAGPMFRKSLEVAVGDVVERDGYVYADLMIAY